MKKKLWCAIICMTLLLDLAGWAAADESLFFARDQQEKWYQDALAEGVMRLGNNLRLKEVIRQTGKIARLNLNLDHLMMEHDIEIHNMQLSQLSEQMNHLNSQILAIENQKAELQQKVDAELKSVSDLRMKQNEITKKIAQME